jgi:hypothetical protein
VNLIGAGIGNTVITSAVTAKFHVAPIFVDDSGKAVRISGFSFVGGAGDQEGSLKSYRPPVSASTIVIFRIL